MCKIDEQIGDLENIIQDIDKEADRIGRVVAYYDNEINKLYHELEVRIFNTSQGNNISRRLQYLLKQRRLAKNDFDKYNSLKSTINLNSLNSKMHRVSKNIDSLKRKHKKYSGRWNMTLEYLEIEESVK